MELEISINDEFYNNVTLSYLPRIGDILSIDGFTYKVVEVTQRLSQINNNKLIPIGSPIITIKKYKYED